ncbi:MAG TPA: hydroxylamine reductase [Anaerolineaceae bacterium]|nr:hydroxylamine reductase [Anaerolineaceae bacterium]HPN51104.1 hydroxylamine reductase [Anaerolineaceae bacterium]
MDTPMFCYQCEQTAQGKGCTQVGVCGKSSEVAMMQDLLIYQLEGISYYANSLLKAGEKISQDIHWFVIDACFATLTNVNFDPTRFYAFLKDAQKIKSELKARAGKVPGPAPLAAVYTLPENEAQIMADSKTINIRPYAQEKIDIQSLKDTLLFGLKGMAAYAHHAWVLGYHDDAVSHHFYKVLGAMVDDSLGAEELVGMVMEFGQVNLACMALLDKANTETYGNPQPTPALITRKKGPFIIVSGHDLHDLAQLLEQTEGKGIHIYTHGEMLPAHGYPGLKKYTHLVGNFGGAWQNQQKEFDKLPGAVLMTTNCLMEPKASYRDRIFTSGVVGWADIGHIEADRSGKKDFTPLINKALELGGWTEDEPEKSILVGFGHEATLSHAGEIIEAVKTGQIRHFFLVGGCDGAKMGRNYYTEFAEKTPKDTVILTLACGKYRFNKREFGTVAGLPRLLDIGQCNDAYSAIQIAVALSKAFNCTVNDLPLTLVLSWYEQKAVCILLTLLSLGIKNIYIGPSLPAFLSPNILQFLVEKFNLTPISTAEKDLATILK